MKNKFNYFLLLFLFLTVCQYVKSQDSEKVAEIFNKFDKKQEKLLLNNYYLVRDYFEEAYEKYPNIPRGIIEAVSFQYSRFCRETTTKELAEDGNERGMPIAYSIMGLTIEGKGVFRENGKLISTLSGYSVSEIIEDNRKAVIAYAAAFSQLQAKYNLYSDSLEKYIPILVDLCELPNDKDDDNFALNSFLYIVYSFLSEKNAATYGFPVRKIDLKKIFGAELNRLQSSVIRISIDDENRKINTCDYSGAIYNPAATCNYTSGRGGVAISSITIHYTQGSYSGSIAWFKNCASKVSAHYIIRSFDGQVTQMVRESDKAWHVGAANSYTIGIEHEAMGDIISYFTSNMYQASAELVRDICVRRNINPHRVFYRDTLDNGTVLNEGIHNLGGINACTQIRGHQHYPNQTHVDPGKYWDWNLYYKLINPNPQVVISTDSSGIFTDIGGAFGDYSNDQRKLFAIHVDGADSIELNFSQFELEPDYDFMWIYNGNSVFSPLIGRWNTQSPGNVIAKGEDLLVEFRSDCATTAPGWYATWKAYKGDNTSDYENQELTEDIEEELLDDDSDAYPNDNNSPSTAININSNDWITKNFTVNFSDNDNIGIKWRFYQVIESDGLTWSANHKDGFICDNFDNSLNQEIWVNNYTNPWQIVNGTLCQNNSSTDYSGIAARINGSSHNAYLYDFYLKFNSQGSCSFLFNCNNAPSLTTYFSGYEICFNKTDKTISIYRIILGAKRLLKKVDNIAYLDNTSYLYRIIFDNESGEILLKRHGNRIFKITDGVLSTTPYSYIGFVTYNSSVSIDNLRVYCSRNSSVYLTVGANESCNLRTQAINEIAHTKLKSIVVDKAYNFSSLVEKKLKIDYTPPSKVSNLNYQIEEISLGNGTTIKYLNANWGESSDNQSGISKYLHIDLNFPILYSTYWNNNSLLTSCNHCYIVTNNSPKFSVVAENKAGLRSALTSIPDENINLTAKPIEHYSKIVVVGPNLHISVKKETIIPETYFYTIYDLSGRKVKEGIFTDETMINTSSLAKSTYFIRISNKKDFFETKKFVNM